MGAETHELEDLRQIGPYPVLSLIYRSELSEIYRCRDISLERELVIKMARRDGVRRRDALARLRVETRVRSAIEHGSVLPVFHTGRSRWGPYLVGPWLPGGTLLERQGEIDLETLAALARQIGGALDALHAAGWVHGDLNGRNILFGGDGRTVLIDFGSVRRIGSRWSREAGSAEMGITPQTVAPEVWHGEPADGRSDLYGLGALLYRCVTGRYPFEAEAWWQLAEQHCGSSVPPPSGLNPDVGPEVEKVLLRALAKEPGERFQTGRELASALSRALAGDGREPLEPAAGAQERAAFPAASPLLEASAQLERFAATLDPQETAALRELLARVEAAEAKAAAEVASLTTGLFGVPAALLALERLGAAAAIGDGALTPAEAAAACGARELTVDRLLEVLAAAGLAGERDGRYFLPPPLGTLYRTGQYLGVPQRPVHAAAELWAQLPHWACTGEPYVSMDRPDGSGYSPVVDVLAGLFTEPAQELARHLRDSGRLPQGAAILDVGAGAAVWSLAAATADPQATVTVVDRPAVTEIARGHAETAGLGGRFEALTGDWRTVPLPRQAFDLVVVANLCHLEPAEDVAALFQRLRPALRTDGRLIVVDTIPETRKNAPLSVLLAGLRLALRTPHGGIHDFESYRGWLAQAGFSLEERLPLLSAEPLSALIAASRRSSRSGSPRSPVRTGTASPRPRSRPPAGTPPRSPRNGQAASQGESSSLRSQERRRRRRRPSRPEERPGPG